MTALTVGVELGPRRYDIVVGSGVLGRVAAPLAGRARVAVVSQTNIPDRHAGDVLAALRTAGSAAEIRWVPGERLVQAGVGEWMELPLWIASSEFSAMQRANVTKAIENGLTFRPLEETISDTLAWDAERGRPPLEGVGLSPDRERELLLGGA